MKRTPLWIFVAAVGVQLAALGLCTWVMEHWPIAAEPKKRRPATAATEPEQPAPSRAEEPSAPWHAEEPSPQAAKEPAPAPPSAAEPLAPSPAEDVPALTAAEVAFVREHMRASAAPPETTSAGEGEASVPPVAPRASFGPGRGGATVRAIDPPPRPVFGAPPHGVEPLPPEIPPFITEVADGTTQLVVGKVGDRSVHFGFYPDGNIRFVDVDNARYTGKAESARARMYEVGGDRSFTVQIGVDVAGRLQATFSGGLHRTATFPLEPLVGWSAA